MKVLCIKNNISNDFAIEIGLGGNVPRDYTYLTIGKEYIVLGVSYDPSFEHSAGFPVFDIKDGEEIGTVPSFLFEITEPSVSKYWEVKYEDNCLFMLPPSFYQEYYLDELTEGIEDVVKDFKAVCKLLEDEQAAKSD